MIKLQLEKNIEVYQKHNMFLSFIVLFFVIAPIIIFSSYLFLVSVPTNFPVGEIVDIKKGSSLSVIGKKLESAGIINSSRLFALGRYKYNDVVMKAGKYSFEKKMDTWEVFEKIASGEGVISDDIKFTIKEGEANYVIARKIAKKMKNIEEGDFIAAAKKYEGQLYPNTYRLNVDATAEAVVERLRSELKKQLNKYNIKIPEEDMNRVLTIASLIESEAGVARYETKRHVSGIIDNRLKKGMMLQLDATFLYIKRIFPKDLAHGINEWNRTIYKSDYKLESKYNTYKYVGLPPGPISNPSIDSIRAALDPMSTSDYFYITGCDGIFYYARTGTQHNVNVKKYLRDKTYCGQF